MASARLQIWSLLLGAYNYTIQFKTGRDNLVADALSRLPLQDCQSNIPTPGETIFLIEFLHNAPLHTKQIAYQDPVLSRVRNLVGREWSGVNETDLAPYRDGMN